MGEEWDKLVEVQKQIACHCSRGNGKGALPRRIETRGDAVRERMEKHLELQLEYVALTGK